MPSCRRVLYSSSWTLAVCHVVVALCVMLALPQPALLLEPAAINATCSPESDSLCAASLVRDVLGVLQLSGVAVQDVPTTSSDLGEVVSSFLATCLGVTSSPLRAVRIMTPTSQGDTTLQEVATQYTSSTGYSVSFTNVDRNNIVREVMFGLETNVSLHDGWIVDAPALGDIVQANGALKLNDMVASDQGMMWDDVHPLVKRVATYDASIAGLPLSGHTSLLYYRRDLLAARNLTVPDTWEQLVAVAAALNGTYDGDGDGQPDAAFCWNAVGCSDGGMQLTQILASLLQYRGSSHGWLLDPPSMAVLPQGEPLRYSLQLLRNLSMYAAAEKPGCTYMNMRFLTGACALTIRGGQQFKAAQLLVSGGRLHGRVGTAKLPGSARVWVRSGDGSGAGRWRACDAALCPYATPALSASPGVAQSPGGQAPRAAELVNQAPYSGFGALLGVMDQRSRADYRAATYKYFSFISSPAASWEQLMLGTSVAVPFRLQHLDPANLKRYVQGGYDADDVQQWLSEWAASLGHPNTAYVLQIPGASRLRDTIDGAAQRVFAGQDDDTIAAALAASLSSVLASLAANQSGGRDRLQREYWGELGYVDSSTPPPGGSGGGGSGLSRSGQVLLGVLVSVVGALLVGLVAWRMYALRRRRARRTLFGRKALAPGVCKDTTLFISDVVDSTSLWELVPTDVMSRAMALHHEAVRSLLPKHDGYESATEGDSFILAFFTAQDALAFALRLQAALLQVAWPPELLEVEVCRPQHAAQATSNVREALRLPASLIAANSTAPGHSPFLRASTTITGDDALASSNRRRASTMSMVPLNVAMMMDPGNEAAAAAGGAGLPPQATPTAQPVTTTTRATVVSFQLQPPQQVHTAPAARADSLSPTPSPTATVVGMVVGGPLSVSTSAALSPGTSSGRPSAAVPPAAAAADDAAACESARAQSQPIPTMSHTSPVKQPAVLTTAHSSPWPAGPDMLKPPAAAGAAAAAPPRDLAATDTAATTAAAVSFDSARRMLLPPGNGPHAASVMRTAVPAAPRSAGAAGATDSLAPPSAAKPLPANPYAHANAGAGGVAAPWSSQSLRSSQVPRPVSGLLSAPAPRSGTTTAATTAPISGPGLFVFMDQSQTIPEMDMGIMASQMTGGSDDEAVTFSDQLRAMTGGLAPASTSGGAQRPPSFARRPDSSGTVATLPPVSQHGSASAAHASALGQLPAALVGALSPRRTGGHWRESRSSVSGPNAHHHHKCVTLAGYYAALWRLCSEDAPGARRVRCGLSIRVGLHSGVASAQEVAYNKTAGRAQYSGSVLATAKAVGDAAQGGMVLLSASTFALLANKGGAAREREQALLLHMGAHTLKGVAGQALDLYCAVSRDLAPRMPLYGPLRSEALVSGGCLGAPLGHVSMAQLGVVGVATLLAWNEDVTRCALAQFERVALGVLSQLQGYVVDHAQRRGQLLAAFQHPYVAARWACSVVCLLKACEWDDELLGHELCEELQVQEQDSDDSHEAGHDSMQVQQLSLQGTNARAHSGDLSSGRTLFRGLRLKGCVDKARAKAEVAPATGRVAYRNSAAGPTQKIAAHASTGQVLVTSAVLRGYQHAVSHNMSDDVLCFSVLGCHAIRGVGDKVELWSARCADEAAVHAMLPSASTGDGATTSSGQVLLKLPQAWWEPNADELKTLVAAD